MYACTTQLLSHSLTFLKLSRLGAFRGGCCGVCYLRAIQRDQKSLSFFLVRWALQELNLQISPPLVITCLSITRICCSQLFGIRHRRASFVRWRNPFQGHQLTFTRSTGRSRFSATRDHDHLGKSSMAITLASYAPHGLVLPSCS